MNRLIFRQKAIDDLSEIWEYTVNEWSENQALKYYEAIRISCEKIANNTDIGRTYPVIGINIKGLKCEKHIIFYSIESDSKIEIIRILHERMDLKSKLSE